MSLVTEECYCDPSVTSVKFNDGCNKQGCDAYAILFFLAYLGLTLESGRKVYLSRHQIKSYNFLSMSILWLGCLLFTIRSLLLLAKVQEPRVFHALLFYSITSFIGGYMLILNIWCDILLKINMSHNKYIIMIIPILKIVIICLIVLLKLAFLVGIIIIWNWRVSNILVLLFFFIISICFLVLGLMIYKNFKESVKISGESKSHKKIKSIIKISSFSIASSLAVVIILWTFSLWKPTYSSGSLIWLFVQRGSLFIWALSILLTLETPKNKNSKTQQQQQQQKSNETNGNSLSAPVKSEETNTEHFIASVPGDSSV
ncbi:hypothetical protein DLAC_05928 [Tieghemostelium lacteum]|uniref:THH1/TOM1/TOM3 domain-containing protein n=1 Tax=Tieghemostelium lacteum TaxID=361077 RepID=A0A151ZH83_TIELA|nr:hypothetical protein DLAC_05928 [Tieghemostelium lacteum]|eukprot:KYQ93269.1 hypothetical protein DLAC_05928 [Tieghemostelium lacteum]